MKPPIEVETLCAVLSALTETRLSVSEFIELAESKVVSDLLGRPNDLARYLESYDLDKNDHPWGPNLPQKRVGGGNNEQHARLFKPDELKKWNDMIDGWEKEIIDLKRSQDQGRKKKLNELRNKIRDARETMRFRGEQHSQRDKGYNIPGFHDAEGLGDEG